MVRGYEENDSTFTAKLSIDIHVGDLSGYRHGPRSERFEVTTLSSQRHAGVFSYQDMDR